MTALTFDPVPNVANRWAGKQPDGRIVGFVRPSRKRDPRYAFEAVLRFEDAGDRNHCGYGDTPDAAKWMLVRGFAFRMGA